ncbi:PREDICTED: fibropellin-1-like [Branchiostoma belcheri]|uniref:Fibropellin-1-like n=1 Tax=Branchiostoma belcheri TaxID=7741 RepID=A0A6P5AG08_BRABE|nr:PREDICTED: fibropellin-1-like [Branchiostoma belcheri]
MAQTQCDGGPPLTLTEQGVQEFTTPNFPDGRYPMNARCSWLIQVTSGTIELQFPDFNLPYEVVFGSAPCATTTVSIFDGPTMVSTPLGTYCDNTPPPNVTSSTGSSILVTFNGGAFTRVGQGFRATFSVIGGNPVTTPPPPVTTPAAHISTQPALTTPEIDECASNPCQNGATCQDGVNSYTCTCLPGYEGDTCATAIANCAGSPCQNGGTCTDRQFFVGYYCTCPAEYGGTYCEIDLQTIDECASNPCQHAGTCTDALNSYTCSCAPGYQGTNCETDIDECASNPCQNEGTCIDLVNSYACSCAAGFQGTNCETETAGRCASDPCQNGATCVDIPNSYICSCAPGFLGTNCQIDMDECASGPCQHGGTCIDLVDSYTCSCAAGYQGTNCETATTTAPPTTISTPRPLPVQTSPAPGTSVGPTTPPPGTSAGPTTPPPERLRDLPPHPGTTAGPSTPPPTNSSPQDSTALPTTTTHRTTSSPQAIVDCAGNPCQNGGTCTDRQFFSGYYCTCPAEYGGIHCEIDITHTSSPTRTTFASASVATKTTSDKFVSTILPSTVDTTQPNFKPVTTGKPGSNEQQGGDGGLTEDQIILYAVLGAVLALLFLIAIIAAVCLCRRGKKGRYAVKSREQELEKLERSESGQDAYGRDNPAELKSARPDSAYQSLQGSRSSLNKDEKINK